MDKLCAKRQMGRTWLIQRLQKYRGLVTTPFTFGGGLENGGLSDEGMKILKGIFTFDYMGATEFEWGAVPEALNFIAEEAEKKEVVSGNHNNIFYICPRTYETGVKNVIDQLIHNEYDLRLKEYCGLQDAIKADSKQQDVVGWLELDNGFFFFTDQEMFEKVKNLFEIK